MGMEAIGAEFSAFEKRHTEALASFEQKLDGLQATQRAVEAHVRANLPAPPAPDYSRELAELRSALSDTHQELLKLRDRNQHILGILEEQERRYSEQQERAAQRAAAFAPK